MTEENTENSSQDKEPSSETFKDKLFQTSNEKPKEESQVVESTPLTPLSDLPSASHSENQNNDSLIVKKDFNELLEESTSTLKEEPKSKENSTFNKSNSRTWLKIVAIIAGVLMVGGALWGATALIEHQKQEQLRIEQEIADKKAEEARRKLLESAPNPLAVLAGKTAPEVTEGELTATVSKEESTNGILKTTDGNSLYLNNGALTAPVNTCTTNLPTDFCLAARAKYKNENFEVFLVKDLANNRLAEAPKDFKEIKNKENLLLATMAIDINNENIPIAALSTDGGTGFLYFFKSTTTNETIKEIIENTSLMNE